MVYRISPNLAYTSLIGLVIPAKVTTELQRSSSQFPSPIRPRGGRHTCADGVTPYECRREAAQYFPGDRLLTAVTLGHGSALSGTITRQCYFIPGQHLTAIRHNSRTLEVFFATRLSFFSLVLLEVHGISWISFSNNMCRSMLHK